MGLDYSITHEESLIKVTTSGVADYLSTHQMWKDIAAACAAHDCFNILGESKLDAPISTADIYDHESIFRSAGIGADHRIAWVNTSSQAASSLRMVETVLRSRGLLNGGLFPSIREARDWLEKNADMPL